MPKILTPGRLRKKDFELEASLRYIVCSRHLELLEREREREHL